MILRNMPKVNCLLEWPSILNLEIPNKSDKINQNPSLYYKFGFLGPGARLTGHSCLFIDITTHGLLQIHANKPQ